MTPGRLRFFSLSASAVAQAPHTPVVNVDESGTKGVRTFLAGCVEGWVEFPFEMLAGFEGGCHWSWILIPGGHEKFERRLKYGGYIMNEFEIKPTKKREKRTETPRRLEQRRPFLSSHSQPSTPSSPAIKSCRAKTWEGAYSRKGRRRRVLRLCRWTSRQVQLSSRYG